LVLAALQEFREDYTSLIYAQFSKFSNVYSVLLRTYIYSGISSSATATTDVNQIHIAIKLWLMLAHSMVILAKNGEGSVSKVWNALWLEYEGFFNALENEAQVGQHPVCRVELIIGNVLMIHDRHSSPLHQLPLQIS
jgi:hypothetical protein